ncbi:MAG TPA: hypothetical protein HA254_02900 [Candidatus Diapherotrites archaeon]|uniref:dolichyl-phosphooligosaccharide-protein glycotransferase n=1 Tax=Candidatus Iainarchaeum sp. TaxID=3101447 RepID=A0A7J4J0K1_9ARCH|nr:hypothetical protein [Candidatus Diapherotrites archaeon]
MIERAKAYISGHKTELFFVLLVFLLGFGIRAQLMVHPLMFEFDSYFHARIGEYVVQNMSVPAQDPLAYYQVPGGAGLPANDFFWFFTAILFKIATLFSPYNKDLWIIAVKIFPALFGALTSAAMYYLGKEMYGKKAGLTMAVFAAVVPAFVYRTMTGFFEDDSLGFLWMIVGLVFFVRSVKMAKFDRQTLINAVAAGIFFFLMAWTWQMFLLVPLILIAWFGCTMLLMWFRQEGGVNFISIAKNFAICFALFAVLTTAATGTGWIETTTGYVTSYLPVTPANVDRIQTPGGDGTSVYSVSVGEEQKGFPFWGNKYSALIVFPVLALLIFIPYRLLRKKNDYVTFILLFWIVITMFMAFIRLKFTYTLGLPVAAAAGIVVSELLDWIGERQAFEKKAIAFSLGFMFLVGIAAGMFFVPTNTPHIELNTGWKDTLYWLRDNTPQDSKLFNWWDEGHWIGFIAERAASTDNRNYIFKANSDYAKFILATSEEEAYNIVKDYNADYVLVGEDLIGKMGSLGLYAYNTTKIQDPRLNQQAIAIPCASYRDSLKQQDYVQCGGNQLSKAEYFSLPSAHIDEPNQFIDQRTRAFIYRNEEGSKLFVMNKPANDTFVTRLFLDTKNLTHFKLVHSDREVRVFEIIK